MAVSFVHNGLKYVQNPETVLYKLRKHGKYVGIEFHKEGNAFIMDRYFLTDEQNAFIFMVEKDVFNKFGNKNTVNMLRKEVGLRGKYKDFTSKVVM